MTLNSHSLASGINTELTFAMDDLAVRKRRKDFEKSDAQISILAYVFFLRKPRAGLSRIVRG